MKIKRFKLSFFLLLILLNFAACVQAPIKNANASPFSLESAFSPINDIEDVKDAPTTSIYYETAKHQLFKHSEKFDLKLDGVDLIFISESKDTNGKVHVKLQTAINEIPVWSKEIIVHLDAQGVVYAVSGKFHVKPVNINPVIDAQQAGEVAKAYLKHGLSDWEIKQTELVVFPSKINNFDELTYKVTLQRGLVRRFIFVSAITSEVLHNFSGTPSLQLK